MKKPAEFRNFPKEIIEDPRWKNALWRFMAVRRDLTDGDTCWFFIDKGMRGYQFLPIRCDGYDAWELYRGTKEEREKGQKATEAFDKEISYNYPVGLVTNEDISLDRWVATVLYLDENRVVRDIKIYMEKNGHTKAKILEALYG